MILCSDPHRSYIQHKAEIDDAVACVLSSGRYVLSEQVEAFEKEFAEYTGASFAIGAGSGTEALHCALAAAGIGTGDEVITVSHTAVATAAAIRLCGAIPVFVDIKSDSFTLNPALVENAITEKTRAIIPVHLYGNPCDMDSLCSIAKKHRLVIIEDCAQAHGARYNGKKAGTIGDMGCFSFYPTKNLGCFGDGGMITTNNETLAKKLKQIRQYGWIDRYVSDSFGWNTRLDEIQAAVLRVKLKYLEADNDRRIVIADQYNTMLKNYDLVLPSIPSGNKHVFHLYVVKSNSRDNLSAHLKRQGIQTLIHYPVPVHLQPAYALKTGHEILPITESIVNEILSLPMYPEQSDKEIETVADAVKGFFNG